MHKKMYMYDHSYIITYSPSATENYSSEHFAFWVIYQAFMSSAVFFSKSTFSKKFFQEYQQCVK